MEIVDAQVHIWAKDTPERPWPKRNEPHRPEPLGADELLGEMDAAGVDRVIIVPPKWEGERNDLALAAGEAGKALLHFASGLAPGLPRARVRQRFPHRPEEVALLDRLSPKRWNGRTLH